MKESDYLRFFMPNIAEYLDWETWEDGLTLEDLMTLAEARLRLYESEHIETQADVYEKLLLSRNDPIYLESLTAAKTEHDRAVCEMERELSCLPSTAVPNLTD